MSERSAEQEIEDLKQEVDRLRQQLWKSQKLSSMGALTSSITHEFNNILTTVINYAKMGLRHKDAATREKAFNKILQAGGRAAKMTSGMLAYARDKGDHREPTDLVELVQSVLVLVEKDLQMHRVRLETRFVDHPHATINAGQIQQVLLNLIINARQAVSAGGRIILTVQTNHQQSRGEIAIRDTGTGIPPEELRNIFTPFYSTKQTDENGQGGTGLGLALCRDIVESHRGRIRVESTVGAGTTFTLKFPLADAPPGPHSHFRSGKAARLAAE